ncbi:unnamed protein product [Enterobius vermicularis]|uniref:MFS domain-containing protein n=1 Tax=Enterobius vermicularis TaxID=51028 RepID=A0A0N4VL95_ENTVE|nr:unnamed protein product [Enterobius vermicularis]
MDVSDEIDYNGPTRLNKRKLVAVFILLVANLLNYMDRFTIAGVLTELQAYFQIVGDDSSAGLLQTIFIVFYMLFSPLFGYLGDRYNRKIILSSGISFWIMAVFVSTLLSRSQFYLFMFFRGIVGIGEASYSTVAPSIIADLFRGSSRSVALSVFYFAIPLGSGLGFVLGSNVSLWFGAWQWGVRLTSVLGVVCLALIIFVLEEPARGEADHAHVETSTFLGDIVYLSKIKTYVFSTIGFTSIVFLVGALSWWTPALMEHAWSLRHGTSEVEPGAKAQISSTFGMITCLAGFIGVVCGSTLAQVFVLKMWKNGYRLIAKSSKADPYVCSLGAFLAVPFIFSAIIMSSNYVFGTWVLIFFGVTCCCLNWAVNMDMLMSRLTHVFSFQYIVVPQCRSTATAVQTLISHLFGDATSPYLVGLISDSIRGKDFSVVGRFFALQDALYFPVFLLVAAGGFYLTASFTVEEDKRAAFEAMHASDFEPIIIVADESGTSQVLDGVEQSLLSTS